VKRLPGTLALLAAGAVLGQGIQTWDWVLKTTEARYVIYGGGLGDAYAPAPGDTHVAFYVRGAAAKEIFATMGPDKKSECGIEKGGRIREKDHIACRYRPSDGYQCDFGFDLTSGKSIGASIC